LTRFFPVNAVITGLWMCLWFQALPLTTLYPLQIRVRTTSEHGFDEDLKPVSDGDA
jgi:hypothetical protein